jgi:hypothetical protein
MGRLAGTRHQVETGALIGAFPAHRTRHTQVPRTTQPDTR